MNNFAFIVTPVAIEELKSYWPALRLLPPPLIKPFLKKLPPIKIIKIKKVKSTRGTETAGFLIICSLAGKSLAELSVLETIVSATQKAQELGARIIGLGGYAAKVADSSPGFAFKDLKLPVTTGSALLAWSAVEQVYRVAKIKKMDLKRSTAAILNASSPAGSLCSKKFADYVNKVIIAGDNPDKLVKLKDIVSYLNPTIEVQIEEDAGSAARKANIIIDLDGSLPAGEKLKSNAILCGMYPEGSNFKVRKLRSDIAFIEAGLVKLPFPEKLFNNFSREPGVIPAAMAETMLLALEEKFVTYSLGERVNLDKLEEIADTAVRHGFEIWAPGAPAI